MITSRCKGTQSFINNFETWLPPILLKTHFHASSEKKMLTRCRNRNSESLYPQTLFALHSKNVCSCSKLSSIMQPFESRNTCMEYQNPLCANSRRVEWSSFLLIPFLDLLPKYSWHYLDNYWDSWDWQSLWHFRVQKTDNLENIERWC